TGHHDLHLVASLPHFLAHGLADLVLAVHRGGGKNERVAAVAARAGIRASAHVSVATGRSNRLSRDEHAWPFDEPLIHRFLESPVGAARIANGCESAIEHGSQQYPRS